MSIPQKPLIGVVGIDLHTGTLFINKDIVRAGAKSSIMLRGNLPWKTDILSSGLLFPGRTSSRSVVITSSALVLNPPFIRRAGILLSHTYGFLYPHGYVQTVYIWTN